MPYQRSFSFVEGMRLVTSCLSLEAQGCQTKSGEAALVTLKESRTTHLGKSGGNVEHIVRKHKILKLFYKLCTKHLRFDKACATSFIYTHKCPSVCIH